MTLRGGWGVRESGSRGRGYMYTYIWFGSICEHRQTATSAVSVYTDSHFGCIYAHTHPIQLYLCTQTADSAVSMYTASQLIQLYLCTHTSDSAVTMYTDIWFSCIYLYIHLWYTAKLTPHCETIIHQLNTHTKNSKKEKNTLWFGLRCPCLTSNQNIIHILEQGSLIKCPSELLPRFLQILLRNL